MQGVEALSAEDYEATSERMAEDAYQSSPGDYLIYLFHIATYDWASDHIAGARVLDYGTGTGYGAARMAKTAASVTGVDVSQAAVDYARRRYTADNLDFQKIRPIEEGPLPFPDDSFDVVTSFQVIEHVPSPAAYLAEAKRVLKPGGTLLVVTPDRGTRLFPKQRPWNVWHLYEFTPEELTGIVAEQFTVQETLGMTAPPDIVKLELDRCRKLKLAAFPFTFPGAPEAWRQRGLGLLKKLDAARSGDGKPGEQPDFGFDQDAIEISATATPSVNIVIVAQA
jgi:2-polyprenyl-3-methyl-5-hydroxy-6-metoxy-1,4-benzoquinol methylase